MQRNFEEITNELVRLPNRQRLEIARFLLFLDRSDAEEEVETVWENEIADRIRAVDEGRATGIEYEDAMKKIERNFIS